MEFIEQSFRDEQGVEYELCGAGRQSKFDDGFAIIPFPFNPAKRREAAMSQSSRRNRLVLNS